MTSPIVVLIDDDASSRTDIADYLRDVAGFAVADFPNGEEALRYLQTHEERCTAVLLDLILAPGGIPGQDMLAMLTRDYPRVPVIVFTGLDPHGSIQALGQGAYANLQKPLDFKELETTIRDIANREAIFMQMADDVRLLLNSDLCIAWRLNRGEHRFHIAGWSGTLDEQYRQTTTLDATDQTWQRFLKRGEPLFLSDVTDPAVESRYGQRQAAIERGWQSLLTVPLVHEGRVIGLIDSYTYARLDFADPNTYSATVKTLRAFAHQATEAVRYTLLSQQTHLIGELNQVLADTLEDEAVLQSILAKATEAVDADWGYLYLLDADSARLVHRKTVSLSPDGLDASYTTSTAISQSAATAGVVQVDGNVQKEGYSVAAIPLRRGERTIGVLTVKSHFPDYFSADDVSLLQSLSALAAVAIVRAKLARHLQEVSRLALTTVDFEELANYVAKAVRDLTGAVVLLWMLSDRADEGDNWLRIRASAGEISLDFIANAKLSMAPNGSINARALHTGEPIIKPNIISDKEYTYQEMARQHGWHSFMVVPMRGREQEPIGVLSLYDRAIGQLGEPDTQLVQTFANQAAVAFQQQRRIMAMQQLAEVGQTLAIGMTEAHDLLHQVAAIAKDLTGADCTVIYPYEPQRKLFFHAKAITAVGLLDEGKKIVEKPRITGLAAAVRQHKTIIVHDIDQGQLRLDRDKPVIPDNNECQRILTMIRSAQFIQSEKVKSFVGMSLLAHKSNASEASEEVGVLYVNFRSPHYFTTEELQIIRIYSQHVAAVIRSAWLYEEVTRQAYEIETRTRAWQQERERAAAAEKLAVSGKMGAQFVHRINNLGATIPVRINLAKEKLDSQDPEQAEVIRELEQIDIELQDLLQAAEGIKHATETRTSEVININELLETAIERVKRAASDFDIKINVNRALNEKLPAVSVDRTGLLDTFFNVIKNAVDAMPAGGILSVASRLHEQDSVPYAVITIADTGIGIAEKDLSRVFDLFFTTKKSGWGFGLWHDKTFLNQLGGDIEVTSKEGKGSTFSISIPVVPLHDDTRRT